MKNISNEWIGFLAEQRQLTLGDVAEIRTDFEDADFWLIRVHDEDNVGKPVKEYKPNRIGIKVTAVDMLDPRYLYYVFEHLWNQGLFKRLASGTMKRMSIKVSDIKRIPIG